MICVYYDPFFSEWIRQMPNENDFICFSKLDANHITDNNNIYILQSNKKYDIDNKNIINIDNTIFNNYGEKSFKLKYDIQKVYLFFYNLIIPDVKIRNGSIIYNIYNKVLVLINKDIYKIKYPINFDAIETYLYCSFTNKSFFRVGDGEQRIPDGYLKKILSSFLYQNSIQILDKNYKYDKDKLFICYNEIYYNGWKLIATKRSPLYWSPNSYYWKKQLLHQNFDTIYYSSHCFRCCKTQGASNGYSTFNGNAIMNLVAKMFIDKDIIVVNGKSCDVFYEYNSKIDINYGTGNLDSIQDNVVNFVINTLDTIIKKQPEKKFIIFVKGAVLSSFIVNKYYKKYRVCDVGSFNLKKPKNKTQKKSIIFNINDTN